MIAERLLQELTKAPRVLLVEPTEQVAVPIKETMEQNFRCDVDWKRDEHLDYGHLDKYDIIFVDADMEVLEELLAHLREESPYTPVVLIGECRHPYKGIVSIFRENAKDLAVIDEVFGKFKLRVKRHRPSAAEKSRPSLFA